MRYAMLITSGCAVTNVVMASSLYLQGIDCAVMLLRDPGAFPIPQSHTVQRETGQGADWPPLLQFRRAAASPNTELSSPSELPQRLGRFLTYCGVGVCSRFLKVRDRAKQIAKSY
jgi:hypothetical protein